MQFPADFYHFWLGVLFLPFPAARPPVHDPVLRPRYRGCNPAADRESIPGLLRFLSKGTYTVTAAAISTKSVVLRLSWSR